MINIICWVSFIDLNKKLIHMAFDPTDNDHDKLAKYTESFTRKRLSKTGFVICATLPQCSELQLHVSKKISIKLSTKKYKFYDHNNELIEGCTFHYEGLN